MKPGIHPNYVPSKVICACGNVIDTKSTLPEIRVEVCSNCHSFYTGKNTQILSAGRVEKFTKKFGKKIQPAEAKASS